MYDIPEPLRKAEFLNSLKEQEVTSWDFIVSQFGYIRKWNWALAGAFFLGLILCIRIEGADTLGILSALVPLLALTSVSEGGRSMRYGMEELELSSFCIWELFYTMADGSRHLSYYLSGSSTWWLPGLPQLSDCRLRLT